MASLRAAVIGLGRIGSTFDDEITRGGTFFLPYCHAPAYAESPLVELVAGADLNAQQRGWFAERWGLSGDHVYADYREMLQRERLDLVSVCTSARPRAGIIEAVARAGVRGIWAEKPIAVSLAEADSVVQVCREQGTALAVNCHRRWNALFKEIKAMLDAGEFGKLLQITVHGTFGLSSNGSHMLDIVVALLGRPHRVTPFARQHSADFPWYRDNTAAVLEYPAALAVVESVAAEADPTAARRLEVYGSRGSAVLEPLEPPRLRLCLDGARDGYAAGWQEVAVANRPRYVESLRAFLATIRGEQPPDRTFAHELAVQETILAAAGLQSLAPPA